MSPGNLLSPFGATKTTDLAHVCIQKFYNEKHPIASSLPLFPNAKFEIQELFMSTVLGKKNLFSKFQKFSRTSTCVCLRQLTQLNASHVCTQSYSNTVIVTEVQPQFLPLMSSSEIPMSLMQVCKTK